MRAILVLALVLACRGTPSPATAELEVKVDRRVELLAALQRLAGGTEYLSSPATTYVREIDAHFAPFAGHAAIRATRELRDRGLNHDAPMLLAVHLDDELRLRAPVDDVRFRNIDVETYLASVRDLAQASRFADFFASHRIYYQQLEARLRTAISAENPTAWFDRFFGKRAGARFIVVPAPLAGTWNYAPRTSSELYQVLGIAKVDFDERAVIDADMIELLVHEMAHSYINPLFAKHRAALEAHGRRLFARVEQAMRDQAYPTWEIMLNEAAARAVTTLYIRERRGVAAAEAATRREVARSFIWTEQFATLLSTKFAAERARFPDLDAFMPELIGFLATLE